MYVCVCVSHISRNDRVDPADTIQPGEFVGRSARRVRPLQKISACSADDGAAATINIGEISGIHAHGLLTLYTCIRGRRIICGVLP